MRRFGVLSLLLVGLSGIAGPSARANLVTNGNFATGDFTGWVSPVEPSIVIDTSFAPPADTYDAAFTGSGILSQNIATIAGQAYTLSFSLLDEAGFFLDSFSVSFGAFSATFTGDDASAYQAEVLSVPGANITGASTVLNFQGFSPSGQNWNLADVAVVPTFAVVPEPSSRLIIASGLLGLAFIRWLRNGRG